MRQRQHLFRDEELHSGRGKITFKSSVKGVASFTCKMPREAINVIYPSAVKLKAPNAHAVLHLKSGATSCQVEQGEWEDESTAVVFVVQNTEVTVVPIVDPVFGLKVTERGSLVQVKKGTVEVRATGVDPQSWSGRTSKRSYPTTANRSPSAH